MINLQEQLIDTVNANEMYLLVHIARYMSRNGMAYPSNATLLEKTGWSLPTLQKVKQSLAEKKLLEIAPRYMEAGGQTSNNYSILTDGVGFYIGAKSAHEAATHAKKIDSPPPKKVYTTPAKKVSGAGVKNFSSEVLPNEVLTNEALTHTNTGEREIFDSEIQLLSNPEQLTTYAPQSPYEKKPANPTKIRDFATPVAEPQHELNAQTFWNKWHELKGVPAPPVIPNSVVQAFHHRLKYADKELIAAHMVEYLTKQQYHVSAQKYIEEQRYCDLVQEIDPTNMRKNPPKTQPSQTVPVEQRNYAKDDHLNYLYQLTVAELAAEQQRKADKRE